MTSVRSPHRAPTVTASPLPTSLNHLADLPPALVIIGEADVLRAWSHLVVG